MVDLRRIDSDALLRVLRQGLQRLSHTGVAWQGREKEEIRLADRVRVEGEQLTVVDTLCHGILIV